MMKTAPWIFAVVLMAAIKTLSPLSAHALSGHVRKRSIDGRHRLANSSPTATQRRERFRCWVGVNSLPRMEKKPDSFRL